jgi:hypothetical protein
MSGEIDLRWSLPGRGPNGLPAGVVLTGRWGEATTAAQVRELAELVERIEAFIAEVAPTLERAFAGELEEEP